MLKKEVDKTLIKYTIELLERYESSLNIINSTNISENKKEDNNITIKELEFVISSLKK